MSKSLILVLSSAWDQAFIQLSNFFDGVLITRILPGSAADRANLEIGDIIVAVDEKPTRSLSELRAIIGGKSVGESVAIRARRSRDYFTVVVALRPLRPMMW